MCDFLREHHPDNTGARLRYLGDLVKLDESCPEVLEFLELSIDRGMCVQSHFKLACRALTAI